MMAHGYIAASVSACTATPEPAIEINGQPVRRDQIVDVVTRIAEEHALGHVLSALEEENASLKARNADMVELLDWIAHYVTDELERHRYFDSYRMLTMLKHICDEAREGIK